MITDDKLESLTVIGLNGCEEVINFDITLANDIPQADIVNSDTLVCSGESIDLLSSTIMSDTHRPIWFRDEVFITTDEVSVPAVASGDYILQVIDTLSGCESSDTIEVVINPAPLEQLEFVVMDESCAGEMDGFINVTNLEGGDANAIISLEGNIVDLNVENGVEPGSYTLMAEDDLGCIIDTTAVVEPGGFIDVELGPNIRIERGEKVTIIPQFLGDDPTAVTWTGNQGVSSSNVDSLCYIPLIDEQIFITVTNDSGCEAVDSVVMDGRDIGSVVLPDANVKLFVSASLEIRTERRYKELLAKGVKITKEDVKENLAKRDDIDSNREDSPLIQAEDAVFLNTGDLDQGQMLAEAVKICLLYTSDAADE